MMTQPQPPVYRQIVAMVLGLIFALTNGYKGLELLFAAICSPFLFAGIVRLYTGLYRLAHSLISSALISVVVGVSGIGIITSFVLVPAFQKTTSLGVIITFALILCEIFVFCRDVRILKQSKMLNE